MITIKVNKSLIKVLFPTGTTEGEKDYEKEKQMC